MNRTCISEEYHGGSCRGDIWRMLCDEYKCATDFASPLAALRYAIWRTEAYYGWPTGREWDIRWRGVTELMIEEFKLDRWHVNHPSPIDEG